ncbi:MAG: histidine kinase dimerization/phospho-acceptor domain-containing protein, partial [Christensenellaceae bacterium]
MKRKSERKKYVRRQGNASIYFLLWAAFSLFALVIVLLFGVTQNLMLKQTYKDEVSRSLAVDGKAIQKAITEYRGPNYSAFLRYQASLYNAEVYLLNEEGTVLFPVEEIDPDDPVFSERIDFSEKMDRLISRLESSGDKPVIYEDDSGEFVYGAVYEKIGTEPVYLYISKSLELGESVVSQMKVRVMLMAIFVLILSFAVSSAISGVLTNPITEMTEKARRLAAGDFSVDFHGRSYGSEMQELAETLNFARDEISKSDRMQKELIANVSHDFKTPLTMIKAYASMIQEISGDNPEKRTKHTQVIIEEADRLTSLVNDLLDLSKIRSGIAALKPEVFDLSEYTFDVLEKFAYLSETQGYHFESDIEKDLYTEADP